MVDLLPNFLHLGPSKSGTTWLYQVLAAHPEVFLCPAKDLHFFNRCYDRGLDWYRAQFRGAGQRHKVIGAMVRDFLDRVFDGAPSDLLVHLAKDNKLTDKQRRLVKQLIEEIDE